MKVAAIIGSPHGMRGNTGQLLDGALGVMKDAGVDVEVLSLADLVVGPCQACNVCHKTGTCAIKDDFPAIKTALLEADGVVLASPNYIFSVTAQMKALFDRCCGPLHCQALKGKYAAAVVTSGGSGSEEVEAYMLRFLRAMGCWTVGSVSAEAWQLADEGAKGQRLQAAAELGASLVEAIRSKTEFPEQVEERNAFAARMKALMIARKDEWTFEYDYWRSRGGGNTSSPSQNCQIRAT